MDTRETIGAGRDAACWLTTGQVASRTGVTVRTIRYYDRIGLLKPSGLDPARGRLYREADLAALRNIQALKMIGLSLDEIKSAAAEGGPGSPVFMQALRRKKTDVAKETARLRFAAQALFEAVDLLGEARQPPDWSKLSGLVEAKRKERAELEQYETPERLSARTGLYDRFASGVDWFRWAFDRLERRPGMRILEVGCGGGALWQRNAERIPDGWRVTLTDASFGMLEEAKRAVRDPRIKLLQADAQELPFHDGEFDAVIANHMLYHVRDIDAALSECRRVLKEGGMLYASTMSRRHLAEIDRLAADFDPQIRVLDPAMERFCAENGAERLERHFGGVRLFRLTDSLRVDEAEPLVDYILSTPMNASDRLAGRRLADFRRWLAARFEADRHVELTRDLGLFAAVR